MKILTLQTSDRRGGFALLIVMIMLGVSLVILAGAMNRSSSITILNQRNNEYVECANAAEAAVEKSYAIMAWQFQSYGVVGVSNNLASVRTNIPSRADYGYWTNYIFSDASGSNGQTYVNYSYAYSGPLPSTYAGLSTTNAPVYRIISNVKKAGSVTGVIGTSQEDMLLALVPLTTWAIFYNGLLEFSTCASMAVNGRVHANGAIYVGTDASLTFSSLVDSTLGISSPANNGHSAWTTANDNTDFNGTNSGNASGYVTNVPSVTVSLNMTNSHFLIDIPPSAEDSMSITGQQRLFNQAQMVLIVTNGVSGSTNPTVMLTMQAPSSGRVPGADPSPSVWIVTNASPANLATNMPFLILTNSFYDQRENATNIITDINVGTFAKWSATNSIVQSKLNSGVGLYPTILYVANNRTATTYQPGQMAVVRLSNATQLPSNNGYGFSVATPNPLYVLGNYNTQISSSATNASAATTNTAYTVPAALLSDALTILSSSWLDSQSKNNTQSYSSGGQASAVTDTINAAIITGTVPSTDTTSTGFSGGVHNLPRLLQNWGSASLYLNTSILRLWDSQVAIHQFENPGAYYSPPTRQFSYDQNFLNPAKVPPGIPCALVPIRFAWTSPPPGVTDYSNYTHN